MALFHVATLTPTKADLIARWIPTQPWGPSADEKVNVIGGFRFDDPDGRVGLETHIVEADSTLFQVPLTYRESPLEGAAGDGFITKMEHSALGTRWVYDGLSDELFVTMLAGVALTGQGEALGMVSDGGRWHIAPAAVRIKGGGWTQGRVPVDGFALESATTTSVVFHSDRFALTVHRRAAPAPQPPMGLTATWDAQADPVLLAEIREQ